MPVEACLVPKGERELRRYFFGVQEVTEETIGTTGYIGMHEYGDVLKHGSSVIERKECKK